MQRPPGSAGSPPRHQRQPVPLLDPGVIAELEAEIPGAGIRFVASFTAMWDQRLARLEAALQDGNPDEALEAVLSLKVTAAMVGAPRLTAAAVALEEALRSGAGVPGLGRVRDSGERTVASLRQRFPRHTSAAPAPPTAALSRAAADLGTVGGQDPTDPAEDARLVIDGRCGAPPSPPAPLAAAPASGREGPAGTR